MTLLPSNEFGIKGHPGNAYAVNPTCAHPHCNRPSAHAHHCWARSFLKKDYDWVELPDGRVMGNRIGLCVDHHGDVTGDVGGHRARLQWDGEQMIWLDKGEGETVAAWQPLGLLTSQLPRAGEAPPTTGHSHEPDEESCPTCGHRKRKPDPRGEPKPGKLRPAKEWTITVPNDAEIGAAILDDWIEDFAIPLGAEEWTSRLKRYHVLVAVLAWATANRKQFIADLAEAADRRRAG